MRTVVAERATAGRLRRYYRLTDTGASRLEVEVERMRANATIATARLRGRHGLAGGTA
ncbi:hypothetical protein [Streptomyces albidus (ex Kaewkla and Franco 2022)]|uniref:hypothetical protein n=1 Tax=Streptomyces albidus (ex Kaewkla and Franco 2022) TaxID=722709 RepID=UPI0015EFBCCC|nr:hypothetical protein [Streptomyces albidus (ex Kaewkla and Franco 2022)]